MKLAVVVVTLVLFGAGLVALSALSSKVQLDGTPQADSRISAAVRSTVAAADGDETRQVDVETLAGVAHLTGRVASEASRSEIERLARATPGVRDVVNELLVGR